MFGRQAIVVATQSAQRVKMFTEKGIECSFVASDYAEDQDRNLLNPYDFVMLTAFGKAVEVFQANKHAVVIGCDTMLVTPENLLSKTTFDRMIGKPVGTSVEEERAHAKSILQHLNARTHQVLSGVCLLFQKKDLNLLSSLQQLQTTLTGYQVSLEVLQDDTEFYRIMFYSASQVTFHDNTDAALEAYLDIGEYRGKAGAYGYQGHGRSLISKIEGDANTIIGFPMDEFMSLFPQIIHIPYTK